MASSSAATEAQIKSEIQRLTATINQHKQYNKNESWNTGGYGSSYPTYQRGGRGRGNAYVNSNYKPANKYIRPGLNVTSVPTVATAASTPGAGPSSVSASLGAQKKEVVLGGVAFESSARSLVRKDLPKSTKPVSGGKPVSTTRHPYTRKSAHVPPTRGFKLKARRGRNMTLNNSTRPYPYVILFYLYCVLMVLGTRSSRKAKRVLKYSDKPCPRFTTTGACSRGLTCMYQHDPSKIAICWNFLQGNCPNTAETCNLSHEPTPERTPLCLHFVKGGRCTRMNCPFPHVNVGHRKGVCRDFAVLGYCERGLDCDKQHVRECPDFAEKGTCGTKDCKLPHVIRANRNRKIAVVATDAVTVMGSTSSGETMDTRVEKGDSVMLTAEDGQLGDEFISLTFQESESEEEESGSDEEEGESGSEEEEDSAMDDLSVNM
ncbi:hypothetical protein B0H34DRAFT_655761 [Crassisporium funariophilum]|nr:hypothetical protein B0H34DRAFT_655761 [Crassisporium funariophilum]